MERPTHLKRVFTAIGSLIIGASLSACGGEEGPPQPPPPVPEEYANYHMPAGYWNNPEILEQGRQLFIGAENMDVNCASCHGKDGKPVKAGARDFRQTEKMTLYSDSVWFWRISEGVKGTKMKAWKSKLSEDERWKVMTYEAHFGLEGKEWDVANKKWVPFGMAGAASAGETHENGAEGEASHASEGEASHTSEGEASHTSEGGDEHGH